MQTKDLRFKNGKFRIACFSDVHGVKDYDTRVFRDLTAIVDKVQPDLVLFLGDNVWRDGAETPETLRNFITALVKPLNDRNIPWAHVFGNHDAEKYNYHNRAAVADMYLDESLDYCLFTKSPEDVYGESNHIITVQNSQGLVTSAFVMIDSNAYTDKDIFDY